MMFMAYWDVYEESNLCFCLFVSFLIMKIYIRVSQIGSFCWLEINQSALSYRTRRLLKPSRRWQLLMTARLPRVY